MLRPTLIATAVCGTVDILYAMVLTLVAGRDIGDMLRFVGSGPFPPATKMGTAGAILGLLVHFALMAMMVAAFMLVYLAWLMFAAALTEEIMRLNPAAVAPAAASTNIRL